VKSSQSTYIGLLNAVSHLQSESWRNSQHLFKCLKNKYHHN